MLNIAAADVIQPALTGAIRQLPQSAIVRVAFGPLFEFKDCLEAVGRNQRVEYRYIFQMVVIGLCIVAGGIVSSYSPEFIAFINTIFTPTINNAFARFYLSVWILTYPTSSISHYAIDLYMLRKHGDTKYFLYPRRLDDLVQHFKVPAPEVQGMFDFLRGKLREGNDTLHKKSGRLDNVLHTFMYGALNTAFTIYRNHLGFYYAGLWNNGNRDFFTNQPRMQELAIIHRVRPEELKEVLVFCANRLEQDLDVIGSRAADYAQVLGDILSGDPNGQVAFVAQHKSDLERRAKLEELRNQNDEYLKHLQELKEHRSPKTGGIGNNQEGSIAPPVQLPKVPSDNLPINAGAMFFTHSSSPRKFFFGSRSSNRAPSYGDLPTERRHSPSASGHSSNSGDAHKKMPPSTSAALNPNTAPRLRRHNAEDIPLDLTRDISATSAPKQQLTSDQREELAYNLWRTNCSSSDSSDEHSGSRISRLSEIQLVDLIRHLVAQNDKLNEALQKLPPPGSTELVRIVSALENPQFPVLPHADDNASQDSGKVTSRRGSVAPMPINTSRDFLNPQTRHVEPDTTTSIRARAPSPQREPETPSTPGADPGRPMLPFGSAFLRAGSTTASTQVSTNPPRKLSPPPSDGSNSSERDLEAQTPDENPPSSHSGQTSGKVSTESAPRMTGGGDW